MVQKKLLMQSYTLLIILMIGVALLVMITFILWPKAASLNSSDKINGVTALVACLKQKGVTMYGVDTCENCQNQKSIFGTSFEEVNYVNCDFDKICEARGYNYYPVWNYQDKTVMGLQSLPNLSKFAGCSYEK